MKPRWGLLSWARSMGRAAALADTVAAIEVILEVADMAQSDLERQLEVN